MGDAKISNNHLGVLAILDFFFFFFFFWGGGGGKQQEMMSPGSKPTYEEKTKVPPNTHTHTHTHTHTGGVTVFTIIENTDLETGVSGVYL